MVATRVRCPFCHGTKWHVSGAQDMGPKYGCFVKCETCSAQGPRSETPTEAKKNWLLGAQ
jgi:hypothetical protein